MSYQVQDTLTPGYLREAVFLGKTNKVIAAESGVSTRTVVAYRRKYGVGVQTESVALLEAAIQKKADELQVLYIRLEKLKKALEDEDRVDMVKLTELAMKIRDKGKFRWR